MELSSIARRLPDEFVTAPGLSVQRALLLVHRYWPSRSESELQELAQSLRALLEPLLKAPRHEVTAALRDQCERVVRQWHERTSRKGTD
jgi:hypothetical protein